MTRFLITWLLLISTSQAQNLLKGKVTDKDGNPLSGVTVSYIGKNVKTNSSQHGTFTIVNLGADGSLRFSHIGFTDKLVSLKGHKATDSIRVTLLNDSEELAEVVVSTGYYEIPKERSTGAFSVVNEELINRTVSTDLISRLEGVTSGLVFDNRLVGGDAGYNDNYRNLRVRGLSTVNSDTAPLVVVDNFPYDGNIESINPNDVKSVTVLKDAAAASIWGARAANGVIVVTTKSGIAGQKNKMNFTSSVNLGAKPDVYYNPTFLNAADFVDAEVELFNRGNYQSKENSASMPMLSPVVEWLIAARDGKVDELEAWKQIDRLKTLDVRGQVDRYLYQQQINQQYALNSSGGSEKYQYYYALGYDKNRPTLVGEDFKRITLTANSTFKLPGNASFNVSTFYSNSTAKTVGTSALDLAMKFPYNQLLTEEGLPAEVPNAYRLPYVQSSMQEGLLDWSYKPLNEVALANNNRKNEELRINTAFDYPITSFLSLGLKYQYINAKSETRRLQDKDTYYVRNLVNRFTQADGTQIFPYGDVLTSVNGVDVSHSGRLQLNFQQNFGDKHELFALAGAEVRQVTGNGFNYGAYGYDKENLTTVSQLDYTTRYSVRPSGTSLISPPMNAYSGTIDRFLSYYANTSYAYNTRYVLSGSIRWDASNLFGVETNQKGVPLWSLGTVWRLSNESFYDMAWLPRLSLRATFGYNGNINKSATAFPTAAYRNADFLTGLRFVEIVSAGNRRLRWEKVGTWNVGLDFASKGDRVVGSLNLFNKNATDLLGEGLRDPTLGIAATSIRYLLNYGNMRTKGFEVELTTENIRGKLRWNTSVWLNYATNKLTDYNESIRTGSTAITAYVNSAVVPVVGRSVDGLYTLPWIGLSGEDGSPLVNNDGTINTDYNAYVQGFTVDDLQYKGVTVPPFTGSLMNTFLYRNWSLSFNIQFKTGYYFRRSSINYNSFFDNWIAHRDFADRWQNPGDELITDVPSMPVARDNYRDLIYNASEAVVERADHIRLHDVTLNYQLQLSNKRIPIDRMKFFCNARNLGILWKATKQDLDPDYPMASYLPGKTIAFGMQVEF